MTSDESACLIRVDLANFLHVEPHDHIELDAQRAVVLDRLTRVEEIRPDVMAFRCYLSVVVVLRTE